MEWLSFGSALFRQRMCLLLMREMGQVVDLCHTTETGDSPPESGSVLHLDKLYRVGIS